MLNIKNSFFQKMRSIRENILANEDMHKNKSMIVINILTHGTEDGFLKSGEDGYGWHIPDIIGILCSNKSLVNKPILFFICACRGCSGKLPSSSSIEFLHVG